MYGGDEYRHYGNRRGNRGYKRGPHHQGQRYSRNGDGKLLWKLTLLIEAQVSDPE